MMDINLASPSSEDEQARQGGPLPDLNLALLDSSLLFSLRRLQALVMQDFVNRFDALNLRPIQLGALLLIRNNPGSRQSDIAAALGVQRPNFVTMMDELDGRGLTRRTPSTHDRRSYSLGLTPKGEVLVEEALRLLAEHEAVVTSALMPMEREQLVNNLNRIEASLGSMSSK